MKKLATLFLIGCLTPLLAVEQVTIDLTVTNIPTVAAADSFILNSDTRVFTNAYATDQILTNLAGISDSATNLHYALSAYRHADLSYVAMTGTNSIRMWGKSGVAMTIDSTATNWAAWTYTTNTITSGYNIRIPHTLESATNQTNFGSQLLNWFSVASNSFQPAWVSMTNFPGRAASTDWTGTNTFRNGGWTNGSFIRVATLTGTLGNVTNGVATNLIIVNGLLTNATAYSGFSSRGDGSLSEVIGDGATADGDGAVSYGQGADATGDNSVSIGAISSANGNSTVVVGTSASGSHNGGIAIGSGANAGATNSIALGYSATVGAGHTNSIAIGRSVSTTETNQIMIGSASQKIRIPGRIEPTGTISNATFTGSSGVSIGVSGGTMTWLLVRRLNNTALANGENASVAVNASYVKLSGPSAAFTTAGFTNSTQGNVDGQLVFLENITGYAWTIRNDSGYESAPANRIYTMTGQDITLPGQSSATVIYDSAQSRWIVLSTSPARGAFGELFTHDGSTAQAITDADQYYPLTNLLTAGNSLNSTLTAGAAGSTIALVANGYYSLQFSASFEGTASSTFTFAVHTNGGGGYVECDNLEAESKQDVNSDVNCVAMNGILNVPTNTTVQVYVKSDSASDTITIHDANLTLIKMP